MSRILFWVGLICLIVFAIRSKIRSAQKPAIEAETMLECAHCGVFFPAGEAVRFDGAIYCSKAHAALPPN